MSVNLQAKEKHNFDMVSGTQEIFRLLLDALANPGRAVDISTQACKFAANGKWLATALTLLDNECGFYWDGPADLGEEIQFLSGSTQLPFENADFVFLSKVGTNSGPMAADILSRAKRGTHLDPHDSAMIVVAAGGKVECPLLLNGPGIPPDGRTVLLSVSEAVWIKERDAQNFEYPCGVEIVFMREDNSLLAITRKAAVTWPM